ncbi:MAG TPA: photosystem reaction center subunit H [Cyanobacteria bacterium UBA11149]|nr:photosystem reaction center subunit H [Cyanobacteria bacterium UBA11366]HBK65321.1 photosystem reaction center subunit H [Cyanobacteria bacterium UBA11166]HBR72446.1 photosystem reaction center subunit H [Cyanobacteria bacterium UBA11159]HBS69457.1 photosystem reaction center subunit H [Cyanobacteria bacterium UBA11153]HBW91902.1 photosystem reaction center subunit H [Cyanobacteria bacterium UBA11149]HCA98100.1 photosystem reaction center subunit H [Cyanobacteria bacterium UBA9226]
MRSELIRQRSDVLNTQVITRRDGKRLGVVKELLVDIDRREIVALGLRDNLLSVAGMPRYMFLNTIQQIGDVILVEDEDVIEDIDVDAYSTLINSEVITETGDLLGRVRGFKFNVNNGELVSLIIASIGLPQIPDQVISTYELPIDEIASSGPDRLIVFEGSQERLIQLTVGLLERLGIGSPPWERDEEEGYYAPVAQPSNQLGTGIPIQPPMNKNTEKPKPVEETWDDDWQEPEPIRNKVVEPKKYAQLEQDNWGDEWDNRPEDSRQYEERGYSQSDNYKRKYEDDYDDYEVEGDAWDDDVKPEAYKPPRINIPDKTKIPEYEEEAGY